MIGFFSFSFPLGLSLYWNTYTIFGILQQYLLIGPGAAKPYFERVRRKKVAEAKVTAKKEKHGRRK